MFYVFQIEKGHKCYSSKSEALVAAKNYAEDKSTDACFTVLEKVAHVAVTHPPVLHVSE